MDLNKLSQTIIELSLATLFGARSNSLKHVWVNDNYERDFLGKRRENSKDKATMQFSSARNSQLLLTPVGAGFKQKAIAASSESFAKPAPTTDN